MIIPIQWRPKYIEGYEGEYGVVRAGFVFSFKRWKFLAGGVNNSGYKFIVLCKKGEKPKPCTVHRLVAQTFIQNPNNLPQVNHLDEDKQNNAVWNLEWCDSKYNNNYGTKKQRLSEAHKGKSKNTNSKKSKWLYISSNYKNEGLRKPLSQDEFEKRKNEYFNNK